MKQGVVLLVVTLLSTTALAGSSDRIARVVLSEFADCTTLSIADALLLPAQVFKVSNIESFTIKDGIVTIAARGTSDKLSGATSGHGRSAARRHQTNKEIIRWIRRASARLNLAWIVTDKDTGERAMHLVFAGGGEPHPDLAVLGRVLETEFKAVPAIVTLRNLVPSPLIIGKREGLKLTWSSISDSTMSIEFDGPGPLNTLIMVSLEELQQVEVVEDRLTGIRNLDVLFRKPGQ